MQKTPPGPAAGESWKMLLRSDYQQHRPARGLRTGDNSHERGMDQLPSYWICKRLKF